MHSSSLFRVFTYLPYLRYVQYNRGYMDGEIGVLRVFSTTFLLLVESFAIAFVLFSYCLSGYTPPELPLCRTSALHQMLLPVQNAHNLMWLVD